MTRNADAMLVGVDPVDGSGRRGPREALSPSLLRGARPRGRVARAAKLLLFDVPVVTYFSGLNHEWGHQTAATSSASVRSLSFVGSPWSVGQFAPRWRCRPFPSSHRRGGPCTAAAWRRRGG